MKPRLLIFALQFIGIFAFTHEAFARAGGGQDFVSSGSSGGSSGGDITGNLIWFIFGLVSRGGIVPVIILAVVIFLIYSYLKKKGTLGKVADDLRRGNTVGAIFDATLGDKINLSNIPGMPGFAAAGFGGDIQTEIMKIKATDPQFNEQMFKDKAEAAFFKIQEGWERQDTSVMRPYISDGVLQRFTNQLSDAKSRGEKNILENITIGHVDIVDVKSDTTFNYITTKIDASAADYTVDSEQKMIRGSKTINGFTEYWTFLRSIGVVTNLDKQLKDNKCPNCGAPLEVNATGKCNYCGAIVTSGQFDWVVSEIRQQ